MKDSFGESLSVGDTVIYSTDVHFGVTYVKGEITKLYEHNGLGASPDKVGVRVKHFTIPNLLASDHIVYAHEVVKFGAEKPIQGSLS